MERVLYRGMLALYLAVLIWLVLFKLTFHLSSLLDRHHRSLNLIPFAAPSIVNGKINYGEMVLNCLIFIPFGLLLKVNFKKLQFLSGLALILCFSLAVEILQYVFAIGATDITDVITNTAGGFLGLALYYLGNKYISTQKLDRGIIVAGTVLLVLAVSMHVSHFVRRS